MKLARMIFVVFFLSLAACAPTSIATPLPVSAATALPAATATITATSALAPTAVKPTATIAATPTLTPITTLTPTPTRKIDAATPTLTTEDRITALEKKGVFKFADADQNAQVKAALAEILDQAPYNATADGGEQLFIKLTGQSFRESWNTRFTGIKSADFDVVFNSTKPTGPDFLIEKLLAIRPLQSCRDTCFGTNIVELKPPDFSRKDLKPTLFKEIFASRIYALWSSFNIPPNAVVAYGERLSNFWEVLYIERNPSSITTNPVYYQTEFAKRGLTDGFIVTAYTPTPIK
jgi:hypothetical protein